MKDNIVSFLLGLIAGFSIFYIYTSFVGGGNMGGIQGGPGGNMGIPPSMNMDVSEMTDEQLESMAERAGITVDELKERLNSGENMRDIMPARGGTRGDMQGQGGIGGSSSSSTAEESVSN